MLTRRRYDELLDRLEPFRSTNRLLDVGCGDGQFLLAARGRDWSVAGSEYGDGPRQRALAAGLDVRAAPFPAAPAEVGGFDVVCAIEVLEHVPDPRREAREVARLLRPGGACYVTVPNFASLTRRAVGASWRPIEYPEHLNYFTPTTLDRLLTAAGLRPQAVTTTGLGIAELRARLRGKPAAATEARRLDAELRDRVNSSAGLARALSFVNAILALTGTGDTIKVLAVRD
jgi:SAM-dependent methyltransferase